MMAAAQRIPKVVHPFIFGVYPILALLATNINQVEVSETYRLLAAIVVVSAVLFGLFRLITKEWHRAGMAVSWIIFFFFSLNHTLKFSKRIFTTTETLSQFYVLFPLWLIAIMIGPWWIVRVVKRDVQPITQFLNIVGVVSLLFPLYTIGSSVLVAPNQPSAELVASLGQTEGELPDIYYIILDGYGRSDILQEIYQYNNQSFLQALEERGFYIATNSHSNYGQTLLSLSSSLNMTHLEHIPQQLNQPTSTDRSILRQLVHQNQVASLLQATGYQFVAIASGYSSTEVLEADIYIPDPNSTFTSFEMLLFQDTLAGIFITVSNLPYELHRQAVLHPFHTLPQVAQMRGPKFVLAHVLAPHPPFVFDAEGNFIVPPRPFSITEGTAKGVTQEEYITGYREQIAYINQLTLDTIDAILTNSGSPPIIILQGDHGPGSFLNWDSGDMPCVRERFSILNAYLVPDSVKSKLYDTITPANSFRVLFDGLFGSQFGLLPDTSYFSGWYTPYQFIDVTAQTAVSCTP